MNPSWQLLPDALSPDVYTPGWYPQPQKQSDVKTGLLGHGLLRPFRRSLSAQDFESGEGSALLRSEVGLVLGTVCDSATSQGELPWRTEFGSLLQLLRQQNNDAALQSLARVYVAESLSRWIPAVRLVKVTFTQIDDNTLGIHLTYDVVDPSGDRVLVAGLQTSFAID